MGRCPPKWRSRPGTCVWEVVFGLVNVAVLLLGVWLLVLSDYASPLF